MHRFAPLLALVLWWAAAPGVPAAGQSAFLNEFHTNDAHGDYLDANEDGTPDGYSDLEFVEFALETSSGSAFGVRDVVAVFYHADGTYAGYSIGPSLWEAGATSGDYTLYSFGPFSIPVQDGTDPNGNDPTEGALPDDAGGVVLAWYDGTALHVLDAVSYGAEVTLTDDPWFGTQPLPLIPVAETPAPASDTSGLRFYSMGLAGTLDADPTSQTLRVDPRTPKRSALPVPSALPPLSSPPDFLRQAAQTPAGPAERWTRPKTSGLQWTVFANTASPGRVNVQEVLPVELTRFTASADGRDLVLDWATAAEEGNAGFAVEHATHSDPFREVGFVRGAGTTSAPRTYRFRIPDSAPGTHRVRLRQVDIDGRFVYTEPRTVRVRIPNGVHLSPAVPTPTVGRAALRFSTDAALPARAVLYDALGRQVNVLFDATPRPGAIYRLAVNPTGRLASGVYFVRLTAGGQAITRRVVVVD